MVAPVILLSIAAIVAHKPVTVACDVGPSTLVQGINAEAWATVGGSDIHLTPQLCKGITAPLTSFEFAHSLETIIHESTHSSGNPVEGCAEKAAQVLAPVILKQFWHVTSKVVQYNVLQVIHARPADYQPNTCNS